jgi:hypothetical protein
MGVSVSTVSDQERRRNTTPMRETVPSQLALVPTALDHVHVRELEEMGRMLDAHPSSRRGPSTISFGGERTRTPGDAGSAVNKPCGCSSSSR